MGDLIHTSRVRIVKDGGLTGTLAGALAARKIPSHPDRPSSEVEGVIGNIDGKPASQSVQRGIAIERDGDVEEE